MTEHEKQQKEFRRLKRERRKALGLIPPTRKENLETALKAVAWDFGVPRKQVEALIDAARHVFRNDSGVTHHDLEELLDLVYRTPTVPPTCEECDMEMERYEDSPDTGKGGYACPGCGWSQDD